MSSYTTKYQIISIGNEFDTEILIYELKNKYKQITSVYIDLETESVELAYKDRSKAVKLDSLNLHLETKLNIRLSKRKLKSQYTFFSISKGGHVSMLFSQFKPVLSAFGFALGFIILFTALLEYYFLSIDVYPGNLKLYISSNQKTLPLFVILGAFMYLYNRYLGSTKVEEYRYMSKSHLTRFTASLYYQFGRITGLVSLALALYILNPIARNLELYIAFIAVVVLFSYSLSSVKLLSSRNPFILFNRALIARTTSYRSKIWKSSTISGFFSVITIQPINILIFLTLLSSQSLQRSFMIILCIELGYFLLGTAIRILNSKRKFDLSYSYLNRAVGYFLVLYSLLLINTYLRDLSLPSLGDSLILHNFVMLVLFVILLYILFQKLFRKLYSLMSENGGVKVVQNCSWILLLLGLLYVITTKSIF